MLKCKAFFIAMLTRTQTYFKCLKDKNETIFLLNVMINNNFLEAGLGIFSRYLSEKVIHELYDEHGTMIPVYLGKKYSSLPQEKMTVPVTLTIANTK